MSNVYPFLHQEDEGIEAEELFTEGEEGDEADEAIARRGRPRMRPPIRTPQRGGTVPLRPATGFATRAELTATAARLDSKIGTLSTGVKALDGRVRGLDSEVGRVRSALSAETKKREALAGQVNNLQQMSMILPLLTTQQTVTTDAALGTKLPSGSNVVVDNGDQLSRILPMLLFSSAGPTSGQPGTSGGMFGDNNNSMMMLAMAMAFSKK